MRYLWACFIVLIAAGTFFVLRPASAPTAPPVPTVPEAPKAIEAEREKGGARAAAAEAAKGSDADLVKANVPAASTPSEPAKVGEAGKPVAASAVTKEENKPQTKSETAPSDTAALEGVESAKPAATVKTVETSKTADASKPVDGVKTAADAAKPADSAKPTDASNPADSNKPADSAKPSDAAKPAALTAGESADPLAQLAADAIKQASASGGDVKAAAGGGEPFELANHADFPLDKVIAAKATKRADGAIVLDGRFVVTGEGTKANPYKVPWDLLVSAQEVYKPRSGLKKMPQRVTFLHDKYIKIVGFVAFPITSTNPKELLVMLNQWDGCCIGYPPTVFDAIEVALAGPPTNTQRMAVHGALDGRFRVDPYDEDGWIVGLYIMREGVLSPD